MRIIDARIPDQAEIRILTSRQRKPRLIIIKPEIYPTGAKQVLAEYFQNLGLAVVETDPKPAGVGFVPAVKPSRQ